MRLSEVKAILQSISVEESKLSFKHVDGTGYDVSNLAAFKEFLRKVSSIFFYKNEVEELTNSVLYTTSQNTIRVSTEKTRQISKNSNYICNSAEALQKALTSIIPESEENTIHVKLPCSNDLHLMIKSITEFEKSINQVIVNDIINGYIKIKRWESGSFWIELILGSQAAVTLIAGVAWSAAVISKKITEGKIIEQHVRSLGIKNESLEDLLQKQKEITDLLLYHEVKNLQVKHFGTDNDNEITERLKLTTKTFAELIQQGAEVHPALNAPEQVQNVFPDFNQLDSLTTQIKQIEHDSKGEAS
jgi:hypothetical protein